MSEHFIIIIIGRLRDFGPYCADNIKLLRQICRLHIHDANLPFHHIPKVLVDWDLVNVEAMYSEFIVSHWKLPSEDGYIVIITQVITILRLAVAFNWALNDAQLVLRGPKCGNKIFPTPLHHLNCWYKEATPLHHLNCWYKEGWIHVFMLFMPNSDPTIWMSQQKCRPGSTFP